MVLTVGGVTGSRIISDEERDNRPNFVIELDMMGKISYNYD